jgi:signal transduction histidine kinase
MITLPLKPWEGKPIGVLQVLNKRRGRLGKQDVSILMIISALMSAAIVQARLYEEVKFAEVGRLLGDIGHDVGNLLTPVLCGVDLLGPQLEKFLDGLGEPEAAVTKQMRGVSRDVLGLLKTSARRIQDQVEQMADCVKGLGMEPQFRPCRVEAVVEQAQQTLSLLAKESHIELRREGLAGLPPILADERRLYLAFYNLINNAIPEVPPGGSITVRGGLGAEEPPGVGVGHRHGARDVVRCAGEPVFAARDQPQGGGHGPGHQDRQGCDRSPRRPDYGGESGGGGHRLPPAPAVEAAGVVG